MFNIKQEIDRATKAALNPPDFIVFGGGTVYMLLPKTAAAKDWVDDNLSSDRQTLGRAIAIEHRFLNPILDGINDAGLTVSGE